MLFSGKEVTFDGGDSIQKPLQQQAQSSQLGSRSLAQEGYELYSYYQGFSYQVTYVPGAQPYYIYTTPPVIEEKDKPITAVDAARNPGKRMIDV